MFRDAKLTQIFEGANQIQRRIIGREILKRARERSEPALPPGTPSGGGRAHPFGD